MKVFVYLKNGSKKIAEIENVDCVLYMDNRKATMVQYTTDNGKHDQIAMYDKKTYKLVIYQN